MLLPLMAVIACDDGDGTSPSTPAAVEVLTTLDAVPVASTEPVRVRVLGPDGGRLEGVVVRWTVAAGGGSVSAEETTTGPDGTTETDWTLGTTVGEQAVRASAADGVGADIAVHSVAGPVDAVLMDRDSVTLGVGDTATLSGTAEDAHGNTVVDPGLMWASTDTGVVEVDDQGRAVGAAAGAAGVVASASGAADTTTVQVLEPGQVSCPALTLGQAVGSPLDTIPVSGIPDTLGAALNAEVLPADTTPADTGRTFVDRNDGTGFMIAPLVPGGNGDGGEVRVRVTDGTLTCPARSFTIEALPEASGTARAIADSLSLLVDLMAQRFGIRAADLEDVSLDTLPDALWPLAIAQEMIGGPANDNSLEAVLEGTAPILDGEGVDLALADRLLAHGGVRSALSEQLDSVRSGLTAGAGRLGSAAATTRFECGPAFVTEPSALDTCMDTQFSAAFQLRSMKDIRFYMGTAFGAAGLIPGAGTASFLAGAVLFIHTSVLKGTANLLPSHFVDGDFTLTNDYYLEDEPGPNMWEQAWVRAASNGWALEQTVLSAILQALGAAGAYDDYINGFMQNTNITRDLIEFVETQLANQAISATSGSDIAEIAADTTPRVYIDSAAWSQQRVNGQAIALTDHRTYEPRVTGAAHLVVGTADQAFPGGHFESVDTVEVGRILVTMDPPERTVDPGDTVTFQSVVANAVDPSMNAEALRGQATTTATDDSVYTIQVATPTDTSAYPFLVLGESTTNTGARAHSSERRLGQAFIYRSGSITVGPDGLCVPFDSTQQFTATVRGLDNTEVQWSTSAGSIDADGVLTAPGSESTVVITATSAVDAGIQGSASALVRQNCQSYGSFTASAGPILFSGDRIQVTVVDSATGNITFAFSESDDPDAPNGFVGPLLEGEHYASVTAGGSDDPSAGAPSGAAIYRESADGTVDTTVLEAGEPWVEIDRDGSRFEMHAAGPAIWIDSVASYRYYQDGTESPGDPPMEVFLRVDLVCKGDACTVTPGEPSSDARPGGRR